MRARQRFDGAKMPGIPTTRPPVEFLRLFSKIKRGQKSIQIQTNYAKYFKTKLSLVAKVNRA